MKKFFPIFIFFIFVCYFFKPFFVNNLLPIPSDTIVGLYHPFRDLYAKDYPRGIPFKNFLITDPIRQLYPWRELAISIEKKIELPLWNPYSFSGYPLLANFQSSVFYPFNILFFLLPFSSAWSLLVFLQPVLAGIFLYLYLKNLKLHSLAAFLGAIVFAFCGFSIAWLEWNTIVQTVLWMPLILLSIDKVFIYIRSHQISNFQFPIFNTIFKISKLQIWFILLLSSFVSSTFGGHIQSFFYLLIIAIVYIFSRAYQGKKYKKTFLIFLLFAICYFLLTCMQWIPTLQFIGQSARDVDQSQWQQAGWFVPWQHLIQFVAPDFFGNPATLNYWGVWNYGEFVGFIGILPLIMAIFAIIFRRDKKTYFYLVLLVFAFVFSLPTPLAKLPFILHIPLLSTAQPTRLMFVIDFSLAILAALGFDYYLQKRRKIFIPTAIVASIFLILWIFVFFHGKLFPLVSIENVLIAKRNLIFPTAVFIAIATIVILFALLKRKVPGRIQTIIYLSLILITIVDLFRFGQKFTSFNTSSYLYPNTKVISFLQKNVGNNRISMLDSRILPPNFTTMYRLQTVEGYDPLYLRDYGEFIAAMQRGKPDISSPFGFNRIITPHTYASPFIDLLGVKYLLSMDTINLPQFKLVLTEGQTKVYENLSVNPRAFFVDTVYHATNKQAAIQMLYDNKNALQKIAIVEDRVGINTFSKGQAQVVSYSENSVSLLTQNSGEGFLILTDIYYPTWHATIDGKETSIFLADYTFRGVIVPSGKHTVVFYDTLF